MSLYCIINQFSSCNTCPVQVLFGGTYTPFWGIYFIVFISDNLLVFVLFLLLYMSISYINYFYLFNVYNTIYTFYRNLSVTESLVFTQINLNKSLSVALFFNISVSSVCPSSATDKMIIFRKIFLSRVGQSFPPMEAIWSRRCYCSIGLLPLIYILPDYGFPFTFWTIRSGRITIFATIFPYVSAQFVWTLKFHLNHRIVCWFSLLKQLLVTIIIWK